MADLRRWIIALAILALFTGLASAQSGGGGGSTLSCSVNTSNTPTLRSEGITEQIGDIVITCTGGTIGDGIAGSQVNITVSLGSQVTSRLISNGSNASTVSEALLLIDEPTSGTVANPGPVPGYGSNAGFNVCPNPGPTTSTNPGGANNGCVAYAYHVVGTGGAVYTIAVNPNTPTSPNAANVYQGVVQGNQVTFYGVPIIPPGTNGARVYRITNVRTNANGIGGGSASGAIPVQASLLTSNPSSLPISNPTPIVGFVQSSLSTSTALAANFGQCVSQTLSQSTILTFSELFGSAWKTRVDPTAPGQVSAAAPGNKGQGNALVQNVPGTIYNSESGFTLTVNGSTAGLADFGTRLKATFNNIPVGARLFATADGYAEFADARTLVRYNTRLVTRDVHHAEPGDLLFFRQTGQSEPYHTMVYLGRSQFEPESALFVVYHTGPFRGGPGEIRRPTVDELMQHPSPQWRPQIGNPNFVGVFRWNVLRRN